MSSDNVFVFPFVSVSENSTSVADETLSTVDFTSKSVFPVVVTFPRFISIFVSVNLQANNLNVKSIS